MSHQVAGRVLVSTLIAVAVVFAPVAPSAPASTRATLGQGLAGAASGPTTPMPGPLAPAPAAEVRPAARYGWPLSPRPSVSRPFQPPTRPYGPGHRGADLVGSPGEPVLAAGDGVVVYAGPLAGRGVVSVQHADGLRTTYEPVTAVVHGGQRVARGQTLGSLAPGHLGCPAPACLHWGLRRDGEYLDPLRLVRHTRVRLLPWPPGGT
jgi:murein DD-endopeptidase MepM/ murein hydrolase activator NlpD